MPHRSIVRIRRNENTKTGLNCLSFVCLYFLLTIFFHNDINWYIFSVVFFLISIGCCCYITIIKDREERLEMERRRRDTLREITEINAQIIDIDIDNLYFDYIQNEDEQEREDEEEPEYDEEREYDEIVTAVPVSPTNQNCMQTVTVYATPV